MARNIWRTTNSNWSRSHFFKLIGYYNTFRELAWELLSWSLAAICLHGKDFPKNSHVQSLWQLWVINKDSWGPFQYLSDPIPWYLWSIPLIVTFSQKPLQQQQYWLKERYTGAGGQLEFGKPHFQVIGGRASIKARKTGKCFVPLVYAIIILTSFQKEYEIDWSTAAWIKPLHGIDISDNKFVFNTVSFSANLCKVAHT